MNPRSADNPKRDAMIATWVVRLFVALLAIGLPIAVILAWASDLTNLLLRTCATNAAKLKVVFIYIGLAVRIPRYSCGLRWSSIIKEHIKGITR